MLHRITYNSRLLTWKIFYLQCITYCTHYKNFEKREKILKVKGKWDIKEIADKKAGGSN